MSAREISPGLTEWKVRAYPEQAAFSADASRMAFALSDGSVAVADLTPGSTEEVRHFPAHEGSCLNIAAHPSGGWITGGDDGLLDYVSDEGEVSEITRRPGQWFEHMDVSTDGTLVAASAGKDVIVLDLSAGSMAELGPHSSTVSGIAISPAGGVLAATRVGGVSLWDLSEGSEAVELELRGLNLAPAFSPDGSYLAMGHQENAIHVLDLESRKVFGLSGLPVKPGKLAWSLNGSHILHSGTRAVVCWPVPECFGENPQPVAFSMREDARMCALAGNSRLPFAACGFDDGVILLAELRRFGGYPLDAEPGSPVTCLRWSASGMHLACAMEDGRVYCLDLGAMLAAG